MGSRVVWRLKDMKQAISDIRLLLADKSLSTLNNDRYTQAAFERFLERLSEASKHVPETWKAEFSQIPWRQVSDLGNFLRHGYDKVDLQVLWSIYENDLDALEHVVDALTERANHPEKPKQ
jgi:uncharacterized protein with HEPN domain